MADDPIQANYPQADPDQAAMQPETFVNPMVQALMAGAAANAAKPGQLMAPNPYPPGSEEANWYEGQREKGNVDWANQQSLGMLGTGAPMAKPGSAGMFGGRLSQTADHRMADMAETMAAHGKNPDEIRKATGWEFSPTDDKWKYEIPDNKLALNYMPDNGTTAKATAGSMFTHPDLFKAYPNLRDIMVKILKSPEMTGGFNPDTQIMHLSVPGYKAGKFIGAHELQHGIQDIEGFAPGTNQSVWAHFLEKNDPEFSAGAYNFKRMQDKAYQGYRGTAGEVEARNVQQRLNYTPLQRQAISPLGEQFADSPTQYVLHPHTSDILKVLRHNPVTNTYQTLGQ